MMAMIRRVSLAALAAAALAPAPGWAADGVLPPSLEARILAQQGLGIGLTTALLESTIDIVNNGGVKPPACKHQTGGSN